MPTTDRARVWVEFAKAAFSCESVTSVEEAVEHADALLAQYDSRFPWEREEPKEDDVKHHEVLRVGPARMTDAEIIAEAMEKGAWTEAAARIISARVEAEAYARGRREALEESALVAKRNGSYSTASILRSLATQAETGGEKT